MEPLAPGQLYRPYTALLLAYGVLSLLWAAVLQTLIPNLDPVLEMQPAFSIDLHLLLGTAALCAAVLRRTRGVAALPASTALTCGIALDFPFGSALTVYWLVRVWKLERQPPSRERTPSLYTMGLYLAGFGCALVTILFRSLLPRLAPVDLFRIFAAAYGGLSLLLIAVPEPPVGIFRHLRAERPAGSAGARGHGRVDRLVSGSTKAGT
jgi:hypothetical protein